MELPPCVVCGKPVLGSAGWTPLLDRAAAAKVRGRTLREERSCIDPRDDRRVWVGHQKCTGITQPTLEGSAEELGLLLERLRRVADEIAAQQQRSHADLHLLRVAPPVFDLADFGLKYLGSDPQTSEKPVPEVEWRVAPPRRSGLRARWDEWRASKDIEAGRREVEKEQRAIQRERDFQEKRKKRLGLRNQKNIDWDRYWGPD